MNPPAQFNNKYPSKHENRKFWTKVVFPDHWWYADTAAEHLNQTCTMCICAQFPSGKVHLCRVHWVIFLDRGWYAGTVVEVLAQTWTMCLYVCAQFPSGKVHLCTVHWALVKYETETIWNYHQLSIGDDIMAAHDMSVELLDNHTLWHHFPSIYTSTISPTL